MRVPASKRPPKKPTPWGAAVPDAPHYEFRDLLVGDPTLGRFMRIGEFGDVKTDFSSREATLDITRATLRLHFALSFTLPAGHLVPVIPGRVQYLRWVVSLLPKTVVNEKIRVLDVGCGPSAIYDLLGARMHPNWTFLGTDSDPQAVALARGLVVSNRLTDQVQIKRTHPSAPLIDHTIWGDVEPSVTICNPPFFECSDEDIEMMENGPSAMKGVEPAGTKSQLGTKGGEVEFVRRMARDSVRVAHVGVFTSLIGLGRDVEKVVKYLRGEEIRAKDVVSVRLKAGKTCRWAVAWRFGPPETDVKLYSKILKCKWKVPIRVIPSGAYANRVTSVQILEVWRQAMERDGWEKCGELMVDEEYSNRAQVGKRMREDDDENGEEAEKEGEMERNKKRTRTERDDDEEEEGNDKDKDKENAELEQDEDIEEREGGEKETGEEEEVEEVGLKFECTQVMKREIPKQEIVQKIRGSAMFSRIKGGSFFLEMAVEEQRGLNVYYVHKLAQEIGQCMKTILDDED